MAVLLEFEDANGDTCRLESVPLLSPGVTSIVEVWCVTEQPVWLTPALARRVAKALTEWADKEEGR